MPQQPTLITRADVQERFETWDSFCQGKYDEDDNPILTPEQQLDAKIVLAEQELMEYLPSTTAETITDAASRHLLNLVRKNCFDIQHGDTEFESKPQIIRDYEATLKRLAELRDARNHAPTITSTEPRFRDGWFR